MDDTEITNSEYRQFVEWVKDSVVRSKLAILADELGLGPEDERNRRSMRSGMPTRLICPFMIRYMMDNYCMVLSETDYYEGRALNWDEDLVWDTSEYPDEYYAEVMVDSMYLPEEESYNGQRSIDVKLS